MVLALIKKNLATISILASIFILSALYTSCKRSGDSPPPSLIPEPTVTAPPPSSSSAPTLTQIQNEIFSPSCATAGCHNSSAQGGLRLDSGNSYSQLVGVNSTQAAALKRVQAGNAGASYIINKLENTQGSVSGSGTVMPPTGAIPASEIQKVKNWINAGAQNN